MVFFTLFIWESFLTISGINKTQHEKQLGYAIENNRINSFLNYYHIDFPNKKIQLKKPEFTFERTTNKLGYSDYEIQYRKSKKEIRLLCLGDSFTEGDGAPFEKSYVFQLREKFLKSPNYYVFNAGKCGSDPFFSFVNYKDILKNYDFDIVLQTLSSSDIEDDINKRGGMERFKKKYIVVNDEDDIMRINTYNNMLQDIPQIQKVLDGFTNKEKYLVNKSVRILQRKYRDKKSNKNYNNRNFFHKEIV
jgi:hypothetical protein